MQYAVPRGMRMVAFAALAGLTFLAVACSSSTGPTGPDLAGTWTGTFRGSTVNLVLSQSDTTLSGNFTDGQYSLSVTGGVSQTGSAMWSTSVDQSTCTKFATATLALNAAADSLTGVAQEVQGAKVCNPSAGGFVQVSQGLMALGRLK